MDNLINEEEKLFMKSNLELANSSYARNCYYNW